MKKVTVPIANATNVTLFNKHYEIIDGEFEVSDEVGQQILDSVDLSGGERPWLVSETDDKPINVGKGKVKK